MKSYQVIKVMGFEHLVLPKAHLIFVTGTTGGACGEKICHVEKILHMSDCHVEKNSPHEKCQQNCNVETFCAQHMVYSRILRCFVAKSVVFVIYADFVAIYALLRGEKLSQKLYLWRKNYKYQVC